MSLQILNDNSGMPVGIFIPFNEWDDFTKKYSINDINLNSFDNLNTDNISLSLAQALKEVSQIENGQLERKSAFQLLDEL